MTDGNRPLTVLHGKFSSYLSWSQPFIHDLISGLGEHVTNVIVCNQTENLDRFPTPNIVCLRYQHVISPTMSVLAAAYLKDTWQPTVLHAHFGWSGIRMLLLRQFLRIPLVTTFGGRDVGAQMHREYYDRLYEILLEASDQIICVSHDLMNQLIDHGVPPERITVIHRGTDLHRFRYVDRSDRDAKAALRLLMVGRIVEKKGHPHVFEALRRLREEGHRAHLTIVGEGDDYEKTRKLRDAMGLHDIVDFAGVTNHAGVRAHMEHADVLLHCSVTGADGDCEGIPNVVVEASATGLPILATRHGGLIELVQHEKNGLLVNERDVPAMVDSLRRLHLDRECRFRLGRTGAGTMKRDWDINEQIRRHLAVYRRVVSEYPAGCERMQQMFIPSGFLQLAESAIQSEDDAEEFSVAEFSDKLLFATGRLKWQTPGAKPSIPRRVYELRRFVPQPVKSALKMALGRGVKRLIALTRSSSGPRRQDRTPTGLDRRILDYFAHGGDLSSIRHDWSVSDLARFLLEALKRHGRLDAEESTAPTLGKKSR
jgi:glycosyltransferase involved in cell wall biosynthesis